MKKRQLFLSLAFFSIASLSYADEPQMTDKELLNNITAVTPRGVRGVTTSLENPNYKNQNWFFGVTTAAWQPKMSGVTNLFNYSTYSLDPIVTVFSASEPNFDWGFSVKGNLGYYFDHDGWALSLGYNYFRTKGSKDVNLSFPSLLIPSNEEGFNLTAPNFQAAVDQGKADFALSGSGALSFILNDAYLKLQRSFFVSDYLSVAPHAGLKSTWFSMREVSSFTGGGTLYEALSLTGDVISIEGLEDNVLNVNNHQKFYAIGPRLGLDTKWYFAKEFNIYTNLTGALLFTFFDHNIKETYSLYPDNLIHAKEKPARVIPYQNIEIGFGYDKDFNNLGQHLTVQIGYEVQNFVGGSIIGGSLGALSTFGFNFNIGLGF